LLRLPGNLIHELSHAVGYLVFGYRVRQIRLCLFDSLGRGSCQPGRPWCPLALPWLATGVAAIAPLLLGSLALRGVATMLGVELQTVSTAQASIGDLLVSTIWANLTGLDFRLWQTYVFLYLAFSIGSELSPSRVDLHGAIPAVLALGAGTIAVLAALTRVPADAPIYQVVTRHMAAVLASLQALLDVGILTVALAVAVTVIPALLVRAARS
jgi:hypothetical protein